MVSLEESLDQATPKPVEPISSPRISFSSEFLDEKNFISICPSRGGGGGGEREKGLRNVDFEFLSGNLTDMLTADELFCEGKLLPYKPMQHVEKLSKITLKAVEDEGHAKNEAIDDQDRRISWFLDDDPSPRPPKCTVLWKELLRLKKQRPSTLSPSSSSSSSSSSESLSTDERKRDQKGVSRVKKGLERTRSATIRIRPMVNVPICRAAKNTSLPPLFPLRRGKLES